jgi:hypothetical protein
MGDREHDDFVTRGDHPLVRKAREQKAADVEQNVGRHRDRVAALWELASSHELLAIRGAECPSQREPVLLLVRVRGLK